MLHSRVEFLRPNWFNNTFVLMDGNHLGHASGSCVLELICLKIRLRSNSPKISIHSMVVDFELLLRRKYTYPRLRRSPGYVRLRCTHNISNTD